ncbi:MAG TPA: molybdopterin cofactor-binding domain-containing protein, partial [Steroidobacteraceae bacterium]|nr:molybdopterin cofactor-binding domain-containing protein [Steroidobacteraceae bacterium]
MHQPEPASGEVRREPADSRTARAIDRRGFLKTSAAISGGLLIQVLIAGGRGLARADTSSRGSLPEAGAKPAVLNAYIRIDPDGAIVLIMPKVEMGQGTFTSLPMLVAEELEVPLGALSLEHAPPDPAVYGVEGDQSTGGSTSIRDCWLPLRKAGAAARLMLIQAAARGWGVAPSSCRAEQGAVIHDSSARRASYGSLASAAATLPMPADPPLKAAKEFKVIGRATPRRDTPDKTHGRTVFGIDAQVPGMRIAILALSPAEGGHVVEPLNTSAAMAVRGVRQVVNDQGDALAVVADDTWSALRGLKALGLRWDAGHNGSVQQTAIVAELEAAAKQPGAIAAHAGNAQEAIKRATSRVDAVYHQPFLAHATMEPMNCTVHWHEDHCEIWVGTQAPDRAVAKLAALGLKPEQIILHNHLIGGGFGRRLEVDGIVIAARIARHVQGPVKVLWTREQDVQHDRYRPYYVDRISAGLDAHGKPLAWLHTIAGSSVSERWSGEPNKNGVDDDAVEVAADPVYALPNLEVRYVKQEPPGVPTSWWRGVGPTRSVFVVESFIDELASAAKQDPVQYRQALIKDSRLRAVLDLAAARASWGHALPQGHGR